MSSSFDSGTLQSDRQTTLINAEGWDVHPMVHPTTALWNLDLESSDISKLLAGYKPTAMEEKWLCCADGPDQQGNIVVHLYRSWTGREQIRLKAAIPVNHGTVNENAGEHSGKIIDITWDKGDQPHQMTEGAAKSLATMVCRRVLGCELKSVSW